MSGSSSSIAYFLIGCVANGQCKKIGTINNGGKLVLDDATASFFPAGTKSREQVLKACRWVRTERIRPNFVDIELRNLQIRIIPING